MSRRFSLPLAALIALFWCAWLAADTPLEIAASKRRHLDSLGVMAWHRAGVTGKGIKVAVLDTGFRNFRDFLGRALPAQVKSRSFRADGNMEARDSQHGILCAELVHDLAPDAELLLATWEPDRPESFLSAVEWCRAEGARIISCSVIMPAWSDGEGGGPVHRRLKAILGGGSKPGDLVAFACAGNLAQRHWTGQFRSNSHGRHQWTQEAASNMITPWGSDRVSVELCSPANASYLIEVTDETTHRQIGIQSSAHGQTYQAAVCRFMPEPGHQYSLRVKQREGSPGVFHLSSLGAWLEHHTAPGSIPFPGDGSEWTTVAAVDREGRRMSYSSCGSGTLRGKPDVSAAVPVPSRCRPQPFSGTSAAAPQAAGLAALIWSKHPDWSAENIRASLVRCCQDLAAPGHDTETGFGRIFLRQP